MLEIYLAKFISRLKILSKIPLFFHFSFYVFICSISIIVVLQLPFISLFIVTNLLPLLWLSYQCLNLNYFYSLCLQLLEFILFCCACTYKHILEYLYIYCHICKIDEIKTPLSYQIYIFDVYIQCLIWTPDISLYPRYIVQYPPLSDMKRTHSIRF